MRAFLIVVGLVLYVAAYVVAPGIAFLLALVLAAAINRWWILLLAPTWMTLPLLDDGGTGGPDQAADWNPYPVVLVIVVPTVFAALAAAVGARRLVDLAIRRRRARARALPAHS